MSRFNDIKSILETQRQFGEKLGQFDRDDDGKLELTKTLLLSLHNEVGQLASSINYRHHVNDRYLNRNKMLFESVDVIRYVAAVLNTWDFTHGELATAMDLKDQHLSLRHELSKKKWMGQPVIIFDMDDVIADFRSSFYEWLESHGVKCDLSGKEYYNTGAILQAGIDPSQIFEDFITSGGMLRLEPVIWLRDEMQRLSDLGYWIQILTARPQENPMCECSTYAWLAQNGVKFDGLAFCPEKYRWLTTQEFFTKGKLAFTIDDSPKHVLEYASHGIRVLSPSKTYNQQLLGENNVSIYDGQAEFQNLILQMEAK